MSYKESLGLMEVILGPHRITGSFLAKTGQVLGVGV